MTPNNSISHRWHACRSGTPFLGPRRFIRATTRVHQTTTWAGAWLHASRPRGAQCGKKGEAMNPASLFFFYLLSSLIAYCSIRPTKKALYYILKGEKKQSTLLQVKRATRQSWEHDGSTAPPPDGSATNSEPRLNQTQQRPALQKQVTSLLVLVRDHAETRDYEHQGNLFIAYAISYRSIAEKGAVTPVHLLR